MRLLPLYNDYIFKALFVRNPDILLNLIGALPQFTNEHKVTEITILNPELPKLGEIDKVSILDIRARDLSGREFILEMQGNSHPFLPERLLLYWSKTFSSDPARDELLCPPQSILHQFSQLRFNR